MTAALTRKQAENAGYTVDTNLYPWVGYKGSGFSVGDSVEVMTEREEELLTQLAAALAPVEMLLFCPRCSQQHTDEADEVCGECGGRPQTCALLGHRPENDRPSWAWTNPPHATHECRHCGLLWRPSNRNTVGVAVISINEPQHFERIAACDPATHTRRLALCSVCKTFGRTFAGGCVNCGDPAL